MSHVQIEDEVVLWKATTIDLGNDKYMMIMYYYHSDKQDKSKTFYKCNIRIDTRENWNSMREELLKVNPAEYFRTSMIGLDDDNKLYYARRLFNKADMYKWIGTKFSETKIQKMENFLNEEFKNVNPYLRKYSIEGNEIDISEVDKIPEGKWFSSFREKKPRKKYGNIVK